MYGKYSSTNWVVVVDVLVIESSHRLGRKREREGGCKVCLRVCVCMCESRKENKEEEKRVRGS